MDEVEKGRETIRVGEIFKKEQCRVKKKKKNQVNAAIIII